MNDKDARPYLGLLFCQRDLRWRLGVLFCFLDSYVQILGFKKGWEDASVSSL